MASTQHVERCLEGIERGVGNLERTADDGVRTSTQQLVQSILDLHGLGLERVLDIVQHAPAAGPALLDELGRDPLVGQLLLLHSLHPLPLAARVRQALDAVRQVLEGKQADVELVSVVDGVVRLRLLGGPEQKAAVERAVLDAAPDLTDLEIEGASEHVVGFVPVRGLKLPAPLGEERART